MQSPCVGTIKLSVQADQRRDGFSIHLYGVDGRYIGRTARFSGNGQVGISLSGIIEGKPLASGVYFARMEGLGDEGVQKFIYLK